jgi:hypothetical protein
MIRPEVQLLVKQAGYDAVAFELGEAQARSESGLYTEAVMRLGRATEATLYAVARKFGINLLLHIPQLAALQKAVRGIEVSILKNREASEVKKLADISKQLSQAIATLMENESSREGTSGDRPRGNDSILAELIEALSDADAKRRLGRTKGLLTKIMTERNSGAHASPDGTRRETDPGKFPELAKDFQEFIEILIEAASGELCPTTKGGDGA